MFCYLLQLDDTNLFPYLFLFINIIYVLFHLYYLIVSCQGNFAHFFLKMLFTLELCFSPFLLNSLVILFRVLLSRPLWEKFSIVSFGNILLFRLDVFPRDFSCVIC
uniref:Uncharacterized protein n=1 Tax=Cacopsylla melanoneura TaxID=428564 RepID=A0A8D8ZCP9_9HEMI